MRSFFAKIKFKIYTLLRRSEKYTKADMVYLAKGGFWITLGQVATNAISLLLIIAFANLLPKETYGTYRYILSIAGVLNIFTLTGMNNAVARAVARGNEGALKTSVQYQLKWNLLMSAAFLILGGYYFIHENTLFAVSFLILGIFIPSTLALNTYGAYLEGKKRFGIASVSSITSTFIYAAGILAAIILSGEVIWLIVAYALTTFATTLFFYFYILRKFNPPETDDEETLEYGRELTFIGFIGPIASQIDKILIAHFWGPAQLAVYSLAMAIPDRATQFIKNLVGIGSPKFATKTPEEINTVFYRRIFQGILFGGLAAGAYIAIAPYLFKYVLPQYLDSVFYSQILAIGLLFAIPNRYVSLLMVSQKFSRIIFLNVTVQNIVKIILYLILGIWGGIFGLVAANVSHSFIGTLINIIAWRKSSKKSTLLS